MKIYRIMIKMLSVNNIYRRCVRNSNLKIVAELIICINSL